MTYEDFELQYEMFLAENEMYDNLFSFSGMMHESVGLYMIQEGVKETIMKYIGRITQALTNAWEKFKEIFTQAKNIAYLKFIKNRLDGAKTTIRTEFKINDNNIENPMEPLNNLKLVPLDNYQEMQQYLDNEKEFLQHFYPNFFKDDSKSIKENLEDIIYTNPHDKSCDVAVLKQMYNFCVENFKTSTKSAAEDLKKVNESNKNIERLVSQVVNAQTTSNQTVNAATDMTLTLENFFIFNEAEPGQPNPSNNPGGNAGESERSTFKEPPNNSGQETEQKNESVQKHIVTYCKASTSIFTAKMNICKDIYNEYLRIIRHCIKGEPGTEGENQDNSNTQRQEAPQVDI